LQVSGGLELYVVFLHVASAINLVEPVGNLLLIGLHLVAGGIRAGSVPASSQPDPALAG